MRRSELYYYFNEEESYCIVTALKITSSAAECAHPFCENFFFLLRVMRHVCFIYLFLTFRFSAL